MPGLNKTGPNGQGPMTGRKSGYCAGNENVKNTNFYYGRGLGLGRGKGRGRGFLRNKDVSLYPENKKQELSQLKSLAGNLENELQEIQKRINELEKNR